MSVSAHLFTDTEIENGEASTGTRWLSVGKYPNRIDMFFDDGATIDRLIDALTELRMAKD